ncbi:MAG: alpha-L-fucosidase, partial [Ginsengibacter sp.]
MLKKLFVNLMFLVILLYPDLSLFAQQKTEADSIQKKMQWFEDAKLGIFIHWGMYSVDGVDESWSFYNKKISHDDYMKQMKGFT